MSEIEAARRGLPGGAVWPKVSRPDFEGRQCCAKPDDAVSTWAKLDRQCVLSDDGHTVHQDKDGERFTVRRKTYRVHIPGAGYTENRLRGSQSTEMYP